MNQMTNNQLKKKVNTCLNKTCAAIFWANIDFQGIGTLLNVNRSDLKNKKK
jgi:hypothetical protein